VHWIADSGLSRAVENFLASERPAILETMSALESESPYKKSGDAE